MLWPAKDAAIVVIAEDAGEGATVPLDALTRVVVENAAKGLKGYRILSQEPLVSSLEAAVLVHAAGKMNGQALEGFHGVFVDGSVAIQVTA